MYTLRSRKEYKRIDYFEYAVIMATSTQSSVPASGPSGQSTQSVPPVVLKERDIQGITPIQLCNAITNVVSDSKLEGVQKVNNVWRVYLKDRQTRLELSVKESIISMENESDFMIPIQM